MASRLYPASHAEALERVMRVIDLIAAHPNITDVEVVAALVVEGVGGVDAELLIRFVPCALSFPLLKRMGLDKFPSSYQVRSSAGEWVELPLADEHYFRAALGVGYDVTTQGYTQRVSQETFRAVTSRSAEIRVVNEYFKSGGTELAGATLSPPTFIGLTAEQIIAGR
jgi:hypothetical protein